MILRYPGGKKKVAKFLAPVLVPCDELREPFFGSGAVTFEALTKPNPPKRVWINDIDLGIAALWTTVIRHPDQLAALVESFRPSVASFKDFKESLLDPDAVLSDADRGFRKLAVHQMSYSGLGTKAGSPIGGWDQEKVSKAYTVECRWNSRKLVLDIARAHRLLQGRVHENRCTSYDALDVIQAPGDDVVLYMDPPYVGAGQSLYQHSYTEPGHRGLAEALLNSPHRWLLSYDDHPLVHSLYSSVRVQPVSWAYTINSKEGNKGQELLILCGIALPFMPGDNMEDLIQALFA